MSMTKQNYNQFIELIKELDTIKDLLRWMVTQFESHKLFYGHGTDNAWDEAIALLLFYLKIPVENLGLVLDAKLLANEKQDLAEFIERRVKQRLPLPYITQKAWFADLDFYVDNRVLIPRSPIAELIKNSFEPWLQFDNDLNILEIGTGSACIACAIARYFLDNVTDNVHVDAVDISDPALAVAKINVEHHGLQDYISLIKSDLFSNIAAGKKYNLIVSNPPYVDAAEIEAMPAEFLHEPLNALAAGNDGLDLVRIILNEAANYLTDDGILIVEVGASRPALENAYPDISFLWLDFANGGEGVFLLTRDQLL